MKKEDLIKAFNQAKENKNDICVEIKLPYQKDHELIINRNKSLESKLKYYLENYDKELKHNNDKRVQIINAFSIDFYFEDIYEK